MILIVGLETSILSDPCDELIKMHNLSCNTYVQLKEKRSKGETWKKKNDGHAHLSADKDTPVTHAHT